MPCNCVIELEVPQPGITKFLMMSRVCKNHKPLASTTHKANHAQLSSYVLDLIEEAKLANMKDYEAALTRCEFNFERREVEEQLPTVLKKNKFITEEFAEYVTKPHAFDEHIHDELMKNNG